MMQFVSLCPYSEYLSFTLLQKAIGQTGHMEKKKKKKKNPYKGITITTLTSSARSI